LFFGEEEIHRALHRSHETGNLVSSQKTAKKKLGVVESLAADITNGEASKDENSTGNARL
jgi:hypothetical protein